MIHKNTKMFVNTLSMTPEQDQPKYYDQPIKKIKPIHIYKRIKEENEQLNEELSKRINLQLALEFSYNQYFKNTNVHNLYPLYQNKEWTNHTLTRNPNAYNKTRNIAGYFNKGATIDDIMQYLQIDQTLNTNSLHIEFPKEIINKIQINQTPLSPSHQNTFLSYITKQNEYSQNFSNANELFQENLILYNFTTRELFKRYANNHHPVNNLSQKILDDSKSHKNSHTNIYQTAILDNYYDLPYQTIHDIYQIYNQFNVKTELHLYNIQNRIEQRLNKIKTTNQINPKEFKKRRLLDIQRKLFKSQKAVTIYDFLYEIISLDQFANENLSNKIIDDLKPTINIIEKHSLTERINAHKNVYDIEELNDELKDIVTNIDRHSLIAKTTFGLFNQSLKAMIFELDTLAAKINLNIETIYTGDDDEDENITDVSNVYKVKLNLLKTNHYLQPHKYDINFSFLTETIKADPYLQLYNPKVKSVSPEQLMPYITDQEKITRTKSQEAKIPRLDPANEATIKDNRILHLENARNIDLLTATMDVQPIYFELTDGIFLNDYEFNHPKPPKTK